MNRQLRVVVVVEAKLRDWLDFSMQVICKSYASHRKAHEQVDEHYSRRSFHNVIRGRPRAGSNMGGGGHTEQYSDGLRALGADAGTDGAAWTPSFGHTAASALQRDSIKRFPPANFDFGGCCGEGSAAAQQ